MATANSIVGDLIAQENYQKALRIAKNFRLGISKDDSNKLKLAYECMTHTGFYEQLGTDTTTAITEGIQILIARFRKDE